MQDVVENKIFQIVKDSEGIKASAIAKRLNLSRKEVNQVLYGRLSNACFRDEKFLWYSKKENRSGANSFEASIEKLEKVFAEIDFKAEDLEAYLQSVEK